MFAFPDKKDQQQQKYRSINCIHLFGVFGFFSAGKSYSGINDELIMVSIGMAIAIAVLITLALCYIAREKCQKHREYYVTA